MERKHTHTLHQTNTHIWCKSSHKFTNYVQVFSTTIAEYRGISDMLTFLCVHDFSYENYL